MVNSNPDLAQLHDIHLPDAIGIWPLAPGYYVLALLVILLLWGGTILLMRSIRKGRNKRQALRVLKSYHEDYLKTANSQASAAQISELLKRVALVYYPREQVASLQGEAWISFLNQTARNVDFTKVRSLLIECPFQPPQSLDLLPLFDVAKRWIQQRRNRCLN